MAKRRVQFVLLCEDEQHVSFVIKFLKKLKLIRKGCNVRQLARPAGTGAADQFVLDKFPDELDFDRKRQVAQELIVMLDGDSFGVARRVEQLNDACSRRQVSVRSTGDAVTLIVPNWNIETWLAYLDGETVDERRSDYPKLRRARDCREHVGKLAEMCEREQLRQPAPSSLVRACKEFEALRRRNSQ